MSADRFRLVHSLEAAAQELSACGADEFEPRAAELLEGLQRARAGEAPAARDTVGLPTSDDAPTTSAARAPEPASDARREQQFSLDAAAMNKAVQEQYVERERAARQQIVQFMEENDFMHLPALAVCAGVSFYPDTKRLAAFTGDRLFRCLAASCSSGSPGSPKHVAMQIPASEARATESLFRIIEGEAPTTLCIGEMIELLAVAKFYMADTIVALLPAYFATAMQQMTAPELAWMTAELLAHLADRRDLDEASAALLHAAAASPGVTASAKSFQEFAVAFLARSPSRADEAACRLHTELAQRATLPLHFRMLCGVALTAAVTGGEAFDAARRVLTDVHVASCATPCAHAATISDLFVRACTAAPTAERLALLRLVHRQLQVSHCEGSSVQRLRLSQPGSAVVLGKAGDREMFVARLRLPTADERATETRATESGWWLKLERCPPAGDGCRPTFSLFLNNTRALTGAAIQAAFEIGVIAADGAALRKAQAAAVLIEHVCAMRPGLWVPAEAAVHRSAIRQEFSGTAWGIRHLVDEQALARLGYSPCCEEPVFLFATVQTS